MSRFLKSIVVIVDPHRTKHLALAKAAALAERSGARVTLLNTFMMPTPPKATAQSSRAVLKASIAERTQRLQKIAQPLERRGIKTLCAVEWDFPVHEAVVRFVLKNSPDLVVMESHHHNPLARMFLANTDWELIRTCPCPVWFVRSGSLPAAPQLLVAVDPRHAHEKPAQLDDRLLRTAGALVDAIGGSVKLTHVYQPPLGGSATIIEPIRLPVSVERAVKFDVETKRLVDALAIRHAIKPANRILQTGDAVHALPAVVKKTHAHVLVMGAVSRSRVKQPFIGNTAEKVIDHVDCDVLVVKAANFKTSVKRARVKLR